MRNLAALLFVACLFLGAANPLLAQQRGNKFIALSGGATVGDLAGGGFSTSSRWGGTAGLQGGIRTSRNSVVALEANWVQKGGDNTRLDYIELPLLIGGVGTLADGVWRGRAYAGIGIGFNVACSASGSVDCDRAKSTEWALPLGFTFARWTSGGTLIGVDIRYSLGLSDVLENSTFKNRSWQFRLIVGKGR
jgi:hypothetical protein